MAAVESCDERQIMKKSLLLGIFAGGLALAAPAHAGGYVSIGLPGLSVSVGRGVHVQAGPVAVGVGFPVRAYCAPPVVYAPPVCYAPAPVVYAAPPVCAPPVRVPVPRRHHAPPPLVVYQGPYPSHIAPPFSP